MSAVLFDFGGVILNSPFDALNHHEDEIGLPRDSIRMLNAAHPDDNAWARLERGQLTRDEFTAEFEAEAAPAGLSLDAHRVLEALRGEVRPEMVEAVRRCRGPFRTGLLTNNHTPLVEADPGPGTREVLGMFDVIVESSVVGVRKPEPGFYRIACERLAVDPAECVFLDDLGVNLGPARTMGMTTIKVGEPDLALEELSRVTGLVLE